MTTLICETEITISSQRVVPRKGRAQWMEKHGIPSEKMRFLVRAKASLWEAAGCRIGIKGNLERLSMEAIEALCVPARDLVANHYQHPRMRIPDDRAEVALQNAAKTFAESCRKRKVRLAEEKKAKELATRWAASKNIVHDDPLLCAMEHAVNEVDKEMPFPPCVHDGTVNSFPPRGRVNENSVEVRRLVQDAVDRCDIPDFVKVTVMPLSRIRLNSGFKTVVPVKFEVAGLDSWFRAWSAEV